MTVLLSVRNFRKRDNHQRAVSAARANANPTAIVTSHFLTPYLS